MANTKEIQKRMKSIRDTMKITSAMYMISSAKLRSAKQKLEQTEPYFYTLQSAIARFLRHMPDTTNRYFDQREQISDNEKKRGYIVITADKGLRPRGKACRPQVRSCRHFHHLNIHL